jgi:hypothetical protein
MLKNSSGVVEVKPFNWLVAGVQSTLVGVGVGGVVGGGIDGWIRDGAERKLKEAFNAARNVAATEGKLGKTEFCKLSAYDSYTTAAGNYDLKKFQPADVEALALCVQRKTVYATVRQPDVNLPAEASTYIHQNFAGPLFFVAFAIVFGAKFVQHTEAVTDAKKLQREREEERLRARGQQNTGELSGDDSGNLEYYGRDRGDRS